MPCSFNARSMNAFSQTRTIRSLVLTLLVREALPCRREFSKLMSNHIFRDHHIVIYLAIVDLKYKANEVGQNRGRTCLGPNWWYFLAWSGSLNRKRNNVWSFPDRTRQESTSWDPGTFGHDSAQLRWPCISSPQWQDI